MGTNNNNNVHFTPVIIYNNAETDKLKILSDNKKKAGIYMWTHNESGKRYVGSAVNLNKRFKEYYTKSHLERNKTMYINNAILQHGYDTFSLTF
jgi:excinuclease UvrABC nuclease subunit